MKAKLREGLADPLRRNDLWAMDFVHDQLYDGRKIRILNIIDAYTRFVPAMDVRGKPQRPDTDRCLLNVLRRYNLLKM